MGTSSGNKENEIEFINNYQNQETDRSNKLNSNSNNQNQQNSFLMCDLNAKFSEMINEKIKTEEVIPKVEIKAPLISFQVDWTLNYTHDTLDKILKNFMNKKKIHLGYFSTQDNQSIEPPLKLLKEKGLEILNSSFAEIMDKGFRKECKQRLEKLLNQIVDLRDQRIQESNSNEYRKVLFINNVSVIDTVINRGISRNIYIKKYERKITKIKNTENLNQIKYFTALVIGKSGVGKSCLINNLLKLKVPENVNQRKRGIVGAMEALGGFVTKNNEDYISNTVTGIRCIDTPGCDLNGHDVKHTIRECQKEINKQYESKNPNDYVSIIWYCFTGNRFDDESDVKLIKSIRETYAENQIPVIIVRTEAWDDEETEFFRNFIKKKKLNTDYIGVIAKEKCGKPQKNLFNLIELSISNIQKALNGQFYKVLSKKIRQNLILTLKNENEKISQYTKEKMVLYFCNYYKRSLRIRDLFKFVENLLLICFSFYFEEFKYDKISAEIKKIFNDLIINIMKQCIKDYYGLCLRKVNEIVLGVSLSLIDLQVEIQKSQNSNIKPENLNTLKNFDIIAKVFLFENLFYVSQKILIYLILQKILFPLCDLLKDEYNIIVDELVKDEKVENLLRETYKKKFDELKEKFKNNEREDIMNYPAPPNYPSFYTKY